MINMIETERLMVYRNFKYDDVFYGLADVFNRTLFCEISDSDEVNKIIQKAYELAQNL